jgi:hypothetical protein
MGVLCRSATPWTRHGAAAILTAAVEAAADSGQIHFGNTISTGAAAPACDPFAESI